MGWCQCDGFDSVELPDARRIVKVEKPEGLRYHIENKLYPCRTDGQRSFSTPTYYTRGQNAILEINVKTKQNNLRTDYLSLRQFSLSPSESTVGCTTA